MEQLKNPWLPQPLKGKAASQLPTKKRVPRYYDDNTSNEHQQSSSLNEHQQPSSFNERQRPYSFNGRQRPSVNERRQPSSFNGPQRRSFNEHQQPSSFNERQRPYSFNGRQRPSVNERRQPSSFNGPQRGSFNGHQQPSSFNERQRPYSFNGPQRPSVNERRQPSSFNGPQRGSFNGRQKPSFNERQQTSSSDGFSHARRQTTEVRQSSLGKNNWSDEIYEGLPEPEDEYAEHVKNLREQLFSKSSEKKKKNKEKTGAVALSDTVLVERDEAKGGPLRVEKYPGPAPIDPERLKRHSRGEGTGKNCVRSSFHQVLLDKREAVKEEALAQAARAEVMLTENEGYLEAEEGERTVQFGQRQIASAVDITTATKYFDLKLDHYGPYRMDYNRSGRYLLLGGRKGHVAAMDWTSKKLLCEFNVMEEVFDIKWLHFQTMFAVAQKNAVFVYDNTGCELHCLRKLNKTVRMEFLPYHFLLATLSEQSIISWLDISIGKMVKTVKTNLGRGASFAQNPTNAVLCVGHQGDAKCVELMRLALISDDFPIGHMTMWTPNNQKPAMKMLCHKHPLQALAIDHRGTYMATSGANEVKIWDLRALKGCVQQYKLRSAAKSLSISQRGLLAMGLGNVVEVYRDGLSETADHAYLRHSLLMTQTANLQFCPYEDVLGVAHTKGFSSLIIPGAGEPNFDGLEVNPYQTNSQIKEAEVKALLEKIQPEFITYDPSVITTVDVPSMVEKLKEAEERQVFIPPKISLSHRKGVKGGTAKVIKTKEILYEDARQKFVKENREQIIAQKKKEEEKNFKWTKKEGVSAVLERFQWQRK